MTEYIGGKRKNPVPKQLLGWHDYVKYHMSKHPQLSYAEAMKSASAPYKKDKMKAGGVLSSLGHVVSSGLGMLGLGKKKKPVVKKPVVKKTGKGVLSSVGHALSSGLEIFGLGKKKAVKKKAGSAHEIAGMSAHKIAGMSAHEIAGLKKLITKRKTALKKR